MELAPEPEVSLCRWGGGRIETALRGYHNVGGPIY